MTILTLPELGYIFAGFGLFCGVYCIIERNHTK